MIEVIVAVAVENESDPCLVEVEALEVIVVAGVEVETIADQKVGVLQGVKVVQEVRVLQKRVWVIRRVRAGAKVWIKAKKN